MAAVAEIRNGDSIDFCTRIPAYQESIESPLFSVLGNDWKFRFYCGTSYDYEYYYIYMELKNARSKLRSFKFDYRMSIMNEKNLVLRKGTQSIAEQALKFLSISRNDLWRHLPSAYRTGNIIKFSFCFHLPSDPLFTVQLKPRDKYVQTKSYADVAGGGLSKDFSVLLDSGLYHDVEIRCENRSIKAHKVILCARSEVFKAMLQSDMLEARSGIVKIQDINEYCIQDFVKYLYTDMLPDLNFDKAIALYEAGDKYAVRCLTNRCSEYLQDNLSLENAFQCLALADSHYDKKLKDKIETYILKSKIFPQDEFWPPFCERYPKMALDLYKMSHENMAES